MDTPSFAPKLLLLVACVSASACVRWGIPEDELGDASDSFTTDEPSTDGDPTSAGESTSTETGEDEFPWPEPWPLGPGARVAVWGKTGIPTRNLEMVANTLRYLAGVEGSGDGDGDGDPSGDGDGDPSGDGDGDPTGDGDGDPTGDGDGDPTGDGDGDPSGDGDGDPSGDGDGEPDPNALAILWVDDCDPREDPAGCLAGNVEPFFNMIAGLGTIEFRPLAQVDPLAYDVVVADFCGPVSAEQVAAILGDGGHVLVLGDYWCETFEGPSATRANVLLEQLGTRFDGDLLYNHAFLVADAKQVELLDGVPVIDAWGVALQEHTDAFTAAVGTIDGALLTSRSE